MKLNQRVFINDVKHEYHSASGGSYGTPSAQIIVRAAADGVDLMALTGNGGVDHYRLTDEQVDDIASALIAARRVTVAARKDRETSKAQLRVDFNVTNVPGFTEALADLAKLARRHGAPIGDVNNGLKRVGVELTNDTVMERATVVPVTPRTFGDELGDRMRKLSHKGEVTAEKRSTKPLAKSAYEVAQRNGYTGTQEDWYKSLRSSQVVTWTQIDAYDKAVSEGYTGTLLTYVQDNPAE